MSIGVQPTSFNGQPRETTAQNFQNEALHRPKKEIGTPKKEIPSFQSLLNMLTCHSLKTYVTRSKKPSYDRFDTFSDKPRKTFSSRLVGNVDLVKRTFPYSTTTSGSMSKTFCNTTKNSISNLCNPASSFSTSTGKSHLKFGEFISRTIASNWITTPQCRRYTDDPRLKRGFDGLKETMVNLEQLVDEFEQRGFPAQEFEFDRSGLHPFGLKQKEGLEWPILEAKKGKRSELVKHMHAIIETRGPMSMTTFMNYALTHPVHGYYMKSDVFGKEGDFTTSPEISQMFGELLGAWCAAMWEQLGKPAKLHIVELGPGRGTLSHDMLNATKPLNNFFKSVHLHLVEVSPHLRRMQAQKFGLVYPATIDQEQVAAIPIPEGLDQHLGASQQHAGASSFSINNHSSSSSSFDMNDSPPPHTRPNHDAKHAGVIYAPIRDQQGSSSSSSSSIYDPPPDVTLQSLPGTKISWHSHFDDIPEFPDGEPMLVIAQEFFDALPIHQLEMTKKGWRERLVDMDDHPESPDWFRTILAPSPTPACALIDEAHDSKVVTVGMGMEKCATGAHISQSIATRILKCGGAALFIDYGYEKTSGWSIRGIQNHEFVSIYKDPGNVDLSANVDFAALARAALQPHPKRPSVEELRKLRIYGSINQGDFLASLGIYSRLAKLLRVAHKEDEAKALIDAFHRLTDRRQMGSTYKVLGMFSSPQLVPEGFEGIEAISHDDYFPPPLPPPSTSNPNPQL
jgi:NADH dehydrogenase [ubiquinone] 1 alpha subcomplex assembly factor 7